MMTILQPSSSVWSLQLLVWSHLCSMSIHWPSLQVNWPSMQVVILTETSLSLSSVHLSSLTPEKSMEWSPISRESSGEELVARLWFVLPVIPLPLHPLPVEVDDWSEVADIHGPALLTDHVGVDTVQHGQTAQTPHSDCQYRDRHSTHGTVGRAATPRHSAARQTVSPGGFLSPPASVWWSCSCTWNLHRTACCSPMVCSAGVCLCTSPPIPAV